MKIKRGALRGELVHRRRDNLWPSGRPKRPRLLYIAGACCRHHWRRSKQRVRCRSVVVFAGDASEAAAVGGAFAGRATSGGDLWWRWTLKLAAGVVGGVFVVGSGSAAGTLCPVCVFAGAR